VVVRGLGVRGGDAYNPNDYARIAFPNTVWDFRGYDDMTLTIKRIEIGLRV